MIYAVSYFLLLNRREQIKQSQNNLDKFQKHANIKEENVEDKTHERWA